MTTPQLQGSAQPTAVPSAAKPRALGLADGDTEPCCALSSQAQGSGPGEAGGLSSTAGLTPWRRDGCQALRAEVGRVRRELGRDTYCRTASAGPCSARAASAPSAGTVTGPWLEGPPVPGATAHGPLPAGPTCGSPRPTCGPPAGCGGRPPRPCRPFVAMPCFMHEGNFIPILRAWCLRELLRRGGATAQSLGRASWAGGKERASSWGGGRRPRQERGLSQLTRVKSAGAALWGPWNEEKISGKPMCSLVTQSWPAFETSAPLLPCEEAGACESSRALAGPCQCCTARGGQHFSHSNFTFAMYSNCQSDPRNTVTDWGTFFVT